MQPYTLEHICSYVARLQTPPEVIGPVPSGIRVNFYSTGGEVTGPKVSGTVRAVGGDWLTIRPDGIALLDVRTTIETHDQALIDLTYTGVGDLGEDGYERFVQAGPPPRVPLRVAMRWQSAHPAYQWLNRLQCVGVGEADMERSHARYDVYAVR